MFRGFVLTGVCLAGGLLSLPGESAAGGKIRHPYLHHALFELREANREMKEAGHDFGGHRVKALKATNAAIFQIETALRAAGDNVKAIGYDREIYERYKHHPHLQHAIHELREARQEMEKADHNFGGHRVAAIRDMNFAIEQLELALKFAKR